MIRGFRHYVHRNHPLDPAGCHGCREAMGFLTVPGYQGDADNPICAQDGDWRVDHERVD